MMEAPAQNLLQSDIARSPAVVLATEPNNISSPNNLLPGARLQDPTSRSVLTQNLSEDQAKAVSYQLISTAKAVDGIESNYKTMLENEKKLQKSMLEESKGEMTELRLKLKDAEGKWISGESMITDFKNFIERVILHNEELKVECSNLLRQLKQLYLLYNGLKKMKIKGASGGEEKKEREIETEITLKERIMFLERELKGMKERDAEGRKKQNQEFARDMEKLKEEVEIKERERKRAEEEKNMANDTIEKLRHEIEALNSKIAEIMASSDEKKITISEEAMKLKIENVKLTLTLKTCQEKLEWSEKERIMLSEKNRDYEKNLSNLSYNKKEQQPPLPHSEQKEKEPMNDPQTLEKLAVIEKKLSLLLSYSTTHKNKQRHHHKQNRIYQDQQLGIGDKPYKEEDESEGEGEPEGNNQDEGESDSLEEELRYPTEKGASKSVLKHLTQKILKKPELNNKHIVKLFKLDQISLDDKANEYKNLLKAMGALYFANKHAKLVAFLFGRWKECTKGIIRREEDEEEEQEEAHEEEEDNLEAPRRDNAMMLNENIEEDKKAGEKSSHSTVTNIFDKAKAVF